VTVRAYGYVSVTVVFGQADVRDSVFGVRGQMSRRGGMSCIQRICRPVVGVAPASVRRSPESARDARDRDRCWYY